MEDKNPKSPENLENPEKTAHFVAQAIDEDLDAGRYHQVVTRFPPEPNGFLHIGHAKAICIDFGMASRHGGKVNLRMDDTNPAKEEQAFIDAIQTDVKWLGFEWDTLTYASDCFDQLYDWACELIKAGHAYVDDQTAQEIREGRGDLQTPGTHSPFRDRPVEESLDLFAKMKAGVFEDGAKVLRAKIDMANPNLVMRDPAMYRILKAHHPRTGDTWSIYPMYDWAHGQSDWIEGVTHSLCDLSFEIHRPLYEWFVQRLVDIGQRPAGVEHTPRQIEFARGNITHLMTSKRKLRQLVDGGHVEGWDDPRMPTLSGLRRRGYTPEAIVQFWTEAGVAKRENNIEIAKLENVLRADLNAKAQRRMAVLDPLKVTITNFEAASETFDAVNNPENEADGTRPIVFGPTIYIERADFMEDAPKKFFRLAPGREVRLRYAYWIKCEEVIKNDAGDVVELKCTYDPQTRGGDNPPPDDEGKVRKVKGTIHWVNIDTAVDAQVRLYEHLFSTEDPEAKTENATETGEGAWLANLNPASVAVVAAKVEPALADDVAGVPLQFERHAYFARDPKTTSSDTGFASTLTTGATGRATGTADSPQPASKKPNDNTPAHPVMGNVRRNKEKQNRCMGSSIGRPRCQLLLHHDLHVEHTAQTYPHPKPVAATFSPATSALF